MTDTTSTLPEKPTVYSPSQTNNFSFCPRYWMLEKERWVTRLVEYPELCGVLGTAYAKSMEQYNNTLMVGEVPSVAEAIMAGEINAADAIRKMKADGRSIEMMKDRDFAASFPKLLKKAVELYHKHNPYVGCQILAVEKTYPDHGNCRIDLLIQYPNNDIVVVDYKVKIKLEAAWRQKELSKYTDHWNMMHYAWATGATSYAICMVVLGPKPYIESVPYAIHPLYAGIWGQDAEGMWDHMKAMVDKKTPLYGRTKHYDEYGDCKYLAACTRYGLSTQMMAVEFVQIARRSHVNPHPDGSKRGTVQQGERTDGQVTPAQPGGMGRTGGDSEPTTPSSTEGN